MASPNGVAEMPAAQKPPGVLHLGDIAYERVTVTATINGEPRSFEGWVKGPGCPGRVVAEFGRAWRTYGMATDQGSDAATAEFLTDALKHVLDCDHMTADLLAGDSARGLRILTHLRWLDERAEDEANPEAGSGERSTTGPSSPTSSTSTEASAPTAAAG